MKDLICAAIGIIGGFFASAYGGWSESMTTLIIVMVIDYITGLMVAGIWGRSTKTESGGLESKAGFKGLCKKGFVLLVVLIAARLDLALGTTYIRDATVIGFIANELISVIENAGIMGIPLPSAVTRAIEVLKNKEEK